jgi:hypothetical protein
VKLDVPVDGSSEAAGVARLDAETADGGVPVLDPGGEFGGDGVEAALRGGRQWAGSGRVQETQVDPIEGAGGVAAGGRYELDGDLAGSVVEGGAGADVVAVGGTDSCADGDVAGGVIDVGELVGELVDVDAVLVGGDAFGSQGGGVAGFEFIKCDGASEPVDVGDVGSRVWARCLAWVRLIRSVSSSYALGGSSSGGIRPVSWRASSSAARRWAASGSVSTSQFSIAPRDKAT